MVVCCAPNMLFAGCAPPAEAPDMCSQRSSSTDLDSYWGMADRVWNKPASLFVTANLTWMGEAIAPPDGVALVPKPPPKPPEEEPKTFPLLLPNPPLVVEDDPNPPLEGAPNGVEEPPNGLLVAPPPKEFEALAVVAPPKVGVLPNPVDPKPPLACACGAPKPLCTCGAPNALVCRGAPNPLVCGCGAPNPLVCGCGAPNGVACCWGAPKPLELELAPKPPEEPNPLDEPNPPDVGADPKPPGPNPPPPNPGTLVVL